LSVETVKHRMYLTTTDTLLDFLDSYKYFCFCKCKHSAFMLYKFILLNFDAFLL